MTLIERACRYFGRHDHECRIAVRVNNDVAVIGYDRRHDGRTVLCIYDEQYAPRGALAVLTERARAELAASLPPSNRGDES